MTRLARVKDLEVRLGIPIRSLKGTDLERAKAAIRDASALIIGESCLEFEDYVPDFIRMLCIQIALRLYRYVYIEGAEQQAISHSMGDFSERFTDVSKVTATLTDDELKLLHDYLGDNAPYTAVCVSNYSRSCYHKPKKKKEDYSKLIKLIQLLDARITVLEKEQKAIPEKIKRIAKELVDKMKLKPENLISGTLSENVKIILAQSDNKQLILDSIWGISEE